MPTKEPNEAALMLWASYAMGNPSLTDPEIEERVDEFVRRTVMDPEDWTRNGQEEFETRWRRRNYGRTHPTSQWVFEELSHLEDRRTPEQRELDALTAKYFNQLQLYELQR